ncbi:hypothetical protein [Weissella fangxianensis]|uniref:hypothetical protein n=1 Tax=Weissella fangxianensis TaxID=2953879 RepID=UPI002157C8FE|nr:hypothetical protein [Weissella fangxianensis]
MSLYGFFKNKVNYIDIMLIVVLGVIATIAPFLSHFYNISTDGVYHLARFQSIADSLKDNSIPNTLNFKYVSQKFSHRRRYQFTVPLADRSNIYNS